MENIVDDSFHDVRLDRYLRKKYSDMPLTEIFKAIRVGKIKINGKKTKENYRLQKGDIINIYFSYEETKEKEYINISEKDIEKVKKGIIFENKDILIFNKESGMVMHKGSGHDYGISEIFKSLYKTNDFNFINRIDKDTSGLVIGAKNLPIARELSEEMRNGNINKKYYILVDGIVEKENFTLVSYLKKNNEDFEKVKEYDKNEKDVKESKSHFKVLKRMKDKTLIEGELDTGRTHQLRVQLAGIGHPIVGDSKYGKGLKKMFLFSYYCEILKYKIKIELPLPEWFM